MRRPPRPSWSKSQPSRASRARRAALRQARPQADAEVPKPTALPAGRSSASSTQRAAVFSIVAAAGELSKEEAHWSQAIARRSAAAATGWLAPMTKPK